MLIFLRDYVGRMFNTSDMKINLNKGIRHGYRDKSKWNAEQ